MSWLYTIVFAGLVLSSDAGSVSNPVEQPEQVITAATVQDETEKFEQTYPLNANGRVNVSNVNGSIVVEAWDRPEVKLTYIKRADTKERLADVEIKIDSRPDYFSVEADHQWNKDKDKDKEHWRFGNKLTVDFKIMAPRGAVLNEIETVNGSVAVSNFNNVTRVSAVNGGVTATNIRGTGTFSTVNGEVVADFDRLETGSKISLETVNGSGKLILPSDSNATVKADSLNGNISNDFGLPVRKGKYVGRDMYGRLGNGDVQIKLDSVNGGLNISRKNDGKPLSPATNLLPQKAKSDEEWDKDNDDEVSEVDIEKMNKDIAKAIKEAEKVTAKAVADTKVKIGKLDPVTVKLATDSIERSAEVIAKSVESIGSEKAQERVKAAQARQAQQDARRVDAIFAQNLPVVEKKSDSFAVKGVPMVTVEAKGCSVRVQGWDKQEVQFKVTQFADARNRRPITLSESHSDSAVTINIANPNYQSRGGIFDDDARSVRIDVFVPKKSNLKISANGEIRLEGVSGDVQLTGSTEPVNVRDVSGKLQLVTTEGRARLIGFRGELDSKSECGDLFLEGEFDKISARTTEGVITMTVPQDPNFDIHSNIEAIEIENLKVPTQVTEGQWRFGKGGAKYNFTVPEGHLIVRSTETLR